MPEFTKKLTAHNLFLNLLAEGGAVNILAVVLLGIAVLPYLIRPLRSLVEVLPVVLIVITQLFDASLEAGEMAMLLWTCLAFAMAGKKYVSGQED